MTFEISRNELKTAEVVVANGEEYVVAVVSGLAGIGRPKLEAVIRDLTKVELVPTRFLASLRVDGEVRREEGKPALTKSNWY